MSIPKTAFLKAAGEKLAEQIKQRKQVGEGNPLGEETDVPNSTEEQVEKSRMSVANSPEQEPR